MYISQPLLELLFVNQYILSKNTGVVAGAILR